MDALGISVGMLGGILSLWVFSRTGTKEKKRFRPPQPKALGDAAMTCGDMIPDPELNDLCATLAIYRMQLEMSGALVHQDWTPERYELWTAMVKQIERVWTRSQLIGVR
jgi:hypothetical protein